MITDNDRANFYSILIGDLSNIVQYNNDNRAFEGVNVNLTIDAICDIMLNDSLGDSMQRYAAVNEFILRSDHVSCWDPSYENMISYYQDEALSLWNSEFGGKKNNQQQHHQLNL
jgi:hypothetical protein